MCQYELKCPNCAVTLEAATATIPANTFGRVNSIFLHKYIHVCIQNEGQLSMDKIAIDTGACFCMAWKWIYQALE